MSIFIQHAISQYMPEIVNRSLLHCHAQGLHSIMLLDSPEKRIRLFVTDKDHTMWRNNPDQLSPRTPLSIAFHPHHCHLSLEVVKGNATNWLIERNGMGSIYLDRYLYESAITGGGIGFKREEAEIFKTLDVHRMTRGDGVVMDASAIHTVYVPKNEIAAWFVYEGKEDTEYLPHCWSNENLSQADFSSLYKPAKKSDIYELLNMSGLL